MKMSRYSKASNKDSKFKKLLFDADAAAANAAAGNKPKNSNTRKSSNKPKSLNKKALDVSKVIVYGRSSAAERTKFASPRVNSVLNSPTTPAKFRGEFIAGDRVIIGVDQSTFYARASIGTLSTLFSIVFRIVLTDYILPAQVLVLNTNEEVA